MARGVGEEQYTRFYVRVDTAVVVVHEAGIEAKREGVDVVGSPAPHADEEPLGVVEERVELHAHVHRGVKSRHRRSVRRIN